MFAKRLTAALAACLLAVSLTACGGGLPNYDYHIDMNKYKDAITTRDPAYLKLANKQHPLGAGYAPDELSTLPASLTFYGKEIQLESTVALAAEAMVLELRSQGFTDIYITSGYRTYHYQQILFNTYLGNEMAAHPSWTQAQCEAEVLTYSARPGESEHQTGLCMDLISAKNPTLDESFAENPVYGWLCENAHNFGFILRYPKGKEGITGYSYEPWHYRFVGVEAATRIHEQGITLEEYPDAAP